MISSTTITKIAPALLAAQKQMGEAVKDSNNPFFKSKYADLNSVREAVTPALHSNGISILQLNVAGTAGVKSYVRTTLLHESGEFICSDTEIVCKDASNAQSYGSAISYARRYGLSSMLSVGQVDDDGASASGTTGTETKSSSSNGKTKDNGFGSFRKGSSTNAG